MKTGTAVSYRVFVRNWWKLNPAWTNPDPKLDGLEPDPTARKTIIGGNLTEAEARTLCKEWNAVYKPGRLSRKAEYEAE
jgi:hypothetical protein